MSLIQLFADVKKFAIEQFFQLRKLCKYMNEQCTVAIDEYTIFPLFDCAYFMLVPCNKHDKGDLQEIQ